LPPLRRTTRRSEPRPLRAKARRRTSEKNTKCLHTATERFVDRNTT
jgi:hypothetical protein